MFAPSHSSPMAPHGKMKQTSLDLFGRPSTRLARKEAELKGPGAAKLSSKQKEVGQREQSREPEGIRQGEDDPSTSQDLKHNTLSLEDGWAFLDKEAIIDLVEQIDMDVLAGALVQIALMEGMTCKVSHAICSVALMLVQLRLDAIGDSILKIMETKLDALVGKAAETMSKMGKTMATLQEDIKKSNQSLKENVANITQTAGSYRGILVRDLPTNANTQTVKYIIPLLYMQQWCLSFILSG